MNLEELNLSRLTRGCVVKVKCLVEVQAQSDIRRYSKICENSKKCHIVPFSLSPREYYKVFAVNVVGGELVIWLDLIQDTGYIQPWIYARLLALDDECNKYNEEILSNRKNVNLDTLRTFLGLVGVTTDGK